jgi:RNA polymerase sigma factor (sigma-70 family)
MNNLNFIIKACKDGDTGQQKVLYERYYRYALSIALRYISKPDEARFVVNDSFIKLFRNMNRFVFANNGETEPQLMAWFKKIVTNTAIDGLRSMNKQSRSVVEYTDELCDADSSIFYKDLIRHVRCLPPSYSAVFTMHAIDGFKHFEIARHLGISVGTSKSNLSKAKNNLRKMIKADTSFSLS